MLNITQQIISTTSNYSFWKHTLLHSQPTPWQYSARLPAVSLTYPVLATAQGRTICLRSALLWILLWIITGIKISSTAYSPY